MSTDKPVDIAKLIAEINEQNNKTVAHFEQLRLPLDIPNFATTESVGDLTFYS